MKILFEVLKFAFELLYSSYQYEMEQMKDLHHMETSPVDADLIQEFKNENKKISIEENYQRRS